MHIKFPYAKHDIKQVDIRLATKALKSGVLTRGKFTKQLEDKLCELTESKFAVAVSSGSAALHCAYLALGISTPNRIFSSPITFASAINTAILTGFFPHFIDVESARNMIDIKKLDELNSDAFVDSVCTPTAMGGHSYNQMDLFKWANQQSIPLIADHSHSLGGKIESDGSIKPMANSDFSDMTILSFQATKAITGGGEGGAILTNNEHYYQRLLSIRNHGFEFDEQKNVEHGIHFHEMTQLGLNYRITEVQAALCISQLKRLDAQIAQRNEIAHWYFENLKDHPAILLPKISDPIPAWHLFQVQVKNRNELAIHLKKKGIGTQVHYIPVYKHPYYKDRFNFDGSKYPNAEKVYATSLSLPIYLGLHKKQVRYICDEIKSFFKS